MASVIEVFTELKPGPRSVTSRAAGDRGQGLVHELELGRERGVGQTDMVDRDRPAPGRRSRPPRTGAAIRDPVDISRVLRGGAN
ncbi:MAG TPA: hypothetical protein VHN14_05725 [Kofleriaceae bacterium]|nr:hypothetical protein [Kofleriaceae bacterium]